VRGLGERTIALWPKRSPGLLLATTALRRTGHAISIGDEVRHDGAIELRSFDSLNFPLAWRRVRTWARSGMDTWDRLPYEAIHRLHGDDGPSLGRHHAVGAAEMVVSSKKSGTFRPFIRLEPRDVIVYQALVDQLAPVIESALPPRNQAGAYRQNLDGADDALAGSANNDAFKAGVSAGISEAAGGYVLETDISGYFLGIRAERLRSVLLAAGGPAAVVEDLFELVSGWQALGVRGLPQGVRASSPLGNVYLASVDRLLGERRVPSYRWMDDIWALSASFGEARQVQDQIERHLYEMGLTLNGEKTRILKSATAVARLEPAVARFERAREALAEDLTVVVDTEYGEATWVPDPEELDEDATVLRYQELAEAVEVEALPASFYADMGLIYGKLEALGNTIAVDAVPDVLRRAPDLAGRALRYVVEVAAQREPERARAVFEAVLAPERFSREFERLSACHRALSLPPGDDGSLARRLEALALGDDHPLVRAKALVAWGRHSNPNDVSVIETFLQSAEPRWRAYAVIAAQEKDDSKRGDLYGRWTGSSGELRELADKIKVNPIRWSKL
jgi:hypothetical protein